MQILAGLTQASAGSIGVYSESAGEGAAALSQSQLAAKVGLVFQFPERHFLGSTVYDVSFLDLPRAEALPHCELSEGLRSPHP